MTKPSRKKDPGGPVKSPTGEAKRPQLIVVLGMHRCGTSTITRGLQALGVELGDHLMPAIAHVNDKGFWEDLDLNQLNIEMLQALESDWDHLSPLKRDFVDSLRRKGFLLRAVDLLRKKIGNSRCFGFKDPRVTQLLPFWLDVFAHCELDMGYVLAIRNPISVARSLQCRDRIDLEKSVLMWLGHTVAMLERTAGKVCRVVVDYDRLLQAPEREMTRMASALRLEVDSQEMSTYRSEFIDQQLQHAAYRPDDVSLDEFTASLAGGLYAQLLAAAADEIGIDAPALQAEIARSRSELDRWARPLELIDTLYAFKHAAQHGIAQRDAQIGAVQHELEQQRNQLAGLAAEQAVHNSNYQEILGNREARIAELTQALDKRSVEVTRLNETVFSQTADLDRANRAAADLGAKFAEQQRQLETLARDARAQSAESLRREQEWREQLDAAARRNDENNRAFLAASRQREERFTAQLTAMRAEAERAFDVERQLIQHQQSSQLKEFRRKERALGDTIDRLTQRLLEFENSWVCKLRSVFVPAANPALIDHTEDFGDLDEAQALDAQECRVPHSIAELLTHEDQEFVDLAYRAILGRPADASGLAHYLDKLRHGIGKLEIARILRTSVEGRRQTSQLFGLDAALRRSSWRRLPLLSYILRQRELRRNLSRQMHLARAEIAELRDGYASRRLEPQNSPDSTRVSGK